MTKLLRPLAIGAATLALAGCDGSSDFDDFFERQGFGSTENYIASIRSATFDDGADIDINNDDSVAVGDVDLEVDGVGDIASIDVDGPGSSVFFDEDLGDSIVDDGEFFNMEFDTAGLEAVGRFGDPRTQDLAYHSYGAWIQVDDFGDGELGATVFGEITDPLDVPTGGTATYAGRSTGFYGDEVTDDFLVTQSDIAATARFGDGEVDFVSDNTEVGAALDGPFIDEPDLDVAGTLAIAGFVASGAMATDGGLPGDVTGVFAGPEANEFGGTGYFGTADEAYIFGFGAR